MADLDRYDEIAWAARALRAVADLVQEASRAGDGFELVGPLELGELLEMVTLRFEAMVEINASPK